MGARVDAVENGLPTGSRFSPIRMLDFRKLAIKAGATALARRKASDWHTTDVSPTAAQESTASLVVEATLRELEVDKAYRVMIELLDSAEQVQAGASWTAVNRAKLEEIRLLTEIISAKVTG